MLFILFSLLSLNVFSQEWRINPDHSEISFRIPYLKVSSVNGRFKKFSGKIIFDKIPQSLLIQIDSSSIDTANTLRDGHLQGADFFNVKKYPHIIYKSTKIHALGNNQFKAQGKLSLKGIQKNVDIDFTLTKTAMDTWGYESQFLTFKSKINREDFNLLWNKTLPAQNYLIGSVVNFEGVIQIQPAGKSTPSSKHLLPDTPYLREREKINRGESDESKAYGNKFEDKVIESKIQKNENDEIKGVSERETSNKTQKTYLWWAALWTMGFLGFGAVIIIAFYSKTLFLTKFPQSYEENSILGYFSDFIVIILVLIYSIAFWVVGWL